MTADITTYKVGAGLKWFTYQVTVNGKILNSTPTMYRMYVKEETAFRNGLKLLNKYNHGK